MSDAEKFDCIIVGGGIAGLSAAMTLARANAKFLLIERGEFAGAKNVSGGVLWGSELQQLVPDYLEDQDAAWERFVRHRRLTFLDPQSAFTIDFKSDHFSDKPYTGLIVLRSKFDAWFASKVQEVLDSTGNEESLLATDILVTEILKNEAGKAVGIRAGGDEFYADCIIIAEGVNNLLTRQAGLQSKYVGADYVGTGVKEIIKFDRETLEDRFQLDGLSGLTNEFVGDCTMGVEGGGFLYTNRDSVSIGLVLGLADLRTSGKKPYDILNHFKRHPSVKDMLRGGETKEYSAHVVTIGDMRIMPKELFSDGVMLAGEAANLVLNSGRAIQGMDFAMHSGVLAAQTVLEAKGNGNFTAAFLKRYREKLEESYVMKDLRKFQSAVHFFHNREMFTTVPQIVNDFGRQFFSVKNAPTDKVPSMLAKAIKKHSTFWNMIKLGLKGARSL